MTSTQKSVNSLVLLVDLDIGGFTNVRKDKEISDDIKSKEELGQDSGDWHKARFSKEFLAPVVSWRGAARRIHNSITLPYKKGEAILSLNAKPLYEQHMRTMQEQLDTIKAQLRDGYEFAISDAKVTLGKTFRIEDYPPVEEFLASFFLKVEYHPFPMPEHFMGVLFGADLEQAQQALESLNAARLQEAKEDMWNRVMTPLKHMAQKLSDPKDKVKIYESMMSNITDVLGALPQINLDSDPVISQAAEEIKGLLSKVNLEAIKEEKTIRLETGGQVAQMVSRFAELGKRKFNLG